MSAEDRIQNPVQSPGQSQVIKDRGAWNNKIVGDWSPAQLTAILIAPFSVGALIGYIVAGNKKSGALLGGVVGVAANTLLGNAVARNAGFGWSVRGTKRLED